MRYPIKDIQFHQEGIQNAEDLEPREEGISVAWHSTAIAYLVVGQRAGLPGPAVVSDGKVRLIEDYLVPVMNNAHGLVDFEPVLKSESPALAAG